MRLKGYITNPSVVHNVCASLDRLEKSFILVFNPATLDFIIKRPIEDGLHLHCQLNTERILTDYCMDSGATQGIAMEVEANLLVRSLRTNLSNQSSSTSPAIRFRMRRHSRNTYLRIVRGSNDGTKTQITFSTELPVRLLPDTLVSSLTNPNIPKPSVQFQFPKLEILRHELSRHRAPQRFQVSASLNGEVKLNLRSENAQTSILFQHLPPINFHSLPSHFKRTLDLEALFDTFGFSNVAIDFKAFFKVLQMPCLKLRSSVASIVAGRMLVLDVQLLSYFEEEVGTLSCIWPNVMD